MTNVLTATEVGSRPDPSDLGGPHRTLTRRHVRVGVLAVITVAASLWLPGQAGAAVPASGSPLVVDGTVRQIDGAVSPGSVVQLLAWPSNEVMSTLKVGDSFKLQPVASTLTNSAGAFSLALSPADQLLTASADDSGIVNLDVVTTARDGSVSTFGLPTRITTGSRRSLLTATDDAPSQRVSVDLALSATKESALVDGQQALPAETSPAPVPKWCASTLVASLGNKLTQVGQRYTNSSTIAMTDFTYSTGASSSFGVGFSGTGAFGTFKASGKHTRSSSGTIDFAPSKVSMHDRTYFTWGKFRVQCYLDNGFPVEEYYQARSTAFAGGATSIAVGLPVAPHCVPHGAGTIYTQDGTTATEWTNGVDTSGSLGIDLSSTTGYSTRAAAKFRFLRSGQLCGTDGDPGNTRPGRLRANG